MYSIFLGNNQQRNEMIIHWPEIAEFSIGHHEIEYWLLQTLGSGNFHDLSPIKCCTNKKAIF